MQKIKPDRGSRGFLAVFVLPALLLYALFVILPVLSGIQTSLYDWSGYSDVKTFLGLENYRELFADKVFRQAFCNDMVILLWKEIIILVCSVLLAALLTRRFLSRREKSAYRFILFLPCIISVVIIGILWTFVLHPNIGVLNQLLENIGLGQFAHAWLGEYSTVLPSLIVIACWAGIGLFMITMVAAMNDVPEELYEAARIDGAGEWRQLFSVTLSMIWEQTKFVIITVLYTTLNMNFVIVMATTGGGPNYRSEVMGSYIYRFAFSVNRAGYASAAAVVLFVVSTGMALLVRFLMDRKED